MIAGTHSGSGKTTVSLGLMGVLSKKYRVIPFKVGPDYIDAAYHRFACGHFSYNLDLYMLGEKRLKALYREKSRKGDIAVVEGVMGFFDGRDSTGFGSSAHVARLLGLPVFMVVDAAGMAKSASAMVLGYRDFDRDVNFAGVILNKVGGQKHYELLKECIEKDTGVPAVGFIPKDLNLSLPERHLGLVPACEMKGLEEKFQRLYEHVEKHIDLDMILKAAEKAGPVNFDDQNYNPVVNKGKVKIAIAMDEAFNFYYRAGLEFFEEMGAELVPFSPLKDSGLPEGVSGLYLGGGFPEMFAEALSRNRSMKESVKDAVEAGLPTYAECGGFMYLAKGIRDLENKSYPMAGVYDVEAVMTRGLKHFGYVEAELISDNVLARRGEVLRGHEFHHSEMMGCLKNPSYSVKKPGKKEEWRCGPVYKNCLATYVHIDFFAYPQLVENFVKACIEYSNKRCGG
jgi:cobyrinic acid a,c-diamide synthase